MISSGLSVFAVEPRSVQVWWRRGGDGNPGVQSFDGLTPGQPCRLPVDACGATITVTPPEQDLGALLCRVATVNDTHIGCDYFGLRGRMIEPPATVPHAERCLRSAVRDAVDWGADLLVVKGDLTHHSDPEEWTVIGQVLAGLPLPVVVAPGNHEMRRSRVGEPQAEAARVGLHLVHGVEAIDLPGVRVLLADTTISGKEHGRIGPLTDELCRRAERAAAGVLIGLHHHPQRFTLPTFWPPGIPGKQAGQFLRRLSSAAPGRTLVTTGHTHRHRRYRRHGVTITEVGSTKDFPGTWTGYLVYERGIRQVVRRVSDPSVQVWLDHTRTAVGGLWARWSPGTLEDRCFALGWHR